MDDVNYFAFFPFDLNNNCHIVEEYGNMGRKRGKVLKSCLFFFKVTPIINMSSLFRNNVLLKLSENVTV